MLDRSWKEHFEQHLNEREEHLNWFFEPWRNSITAKLMINDVGEYTRRGEPAGLDKRDTIWKLGQRNIVSSVQKRRFDCTIEVSVCWTLHTKSSPKYCTTVCYPTPRGRSALPSWVPFRQIKDIPTLRTAINLWKRQWKQHPNGPLGWSGQKKMRISTTTGSQTKDIGPNRSYIKYQDIWTTLNRASNSDSIDSEISEISDILAVSKYRNQQTQYR
jgi:hypothetical protein